jgi:hypothetical protein
LVERFTSTNELHERIYAPFGFCSVACREEFAADLGRFPANQGSVGQAIRDDEADRLRHHAQTTNISKEHHKQADIL